MPNKGFDTLVIGLGTYQPALDVGISSPYAHLRQYVVSSTLEKIDDPSVELVSGDPIALVRGLKAEPSGQDIYLAGGGKLAGALLPEIDELIIKWYRWSPAPASRPSRAGSTPPSSRPRSGSRSATAPR